MKNRLVSTRSTLRFLRLSLFAVFIASCAPATATVNPEPVAIQPTATLPAPVPTLDQSTQPTLSVTETLVPTALPIATSRGPNLEATDPTTVKMASGGLQLVEFFEFW